MTKADLDLKWGYELRVPMFSADGQWHVYDATSDNGDTVALVDPDNIMRDLEQDPEAVARLVATAPDLLFQLRLANDKISLIHSDERECKLGVDACDCPLATNWRHNREVIAKAEGKL